MCRWVYPVPRVTAERETQHDKVDKSSQPSSPPLGLYIFGKQTGSRAIVRRDDGFEWQAEEGESYSSLPPLSVCTMSVGCVRRKKEKKKKWRKILSQLCLSSDRWLMNCERSLSVSIQDQPDYVFRRSNMMRPARLFLCLKKGGGLVMQPNNLPSIDDERI